jgi:hypothetical protein
MKTTIKVKTITTQEVEVSLPQFRINATIASTEFIAYYGEKDDDNIYFRVKDGKLSCFMDWYNINRVLEGTPISQTEFVQALNDAKETIKIYGVSASVTNDEQGEYYIEQTQLLNSHE